MLFTVVTVLVTPLSVGAIIAGAAACAHGVLLIHTKQSARRQEILLDIRMRRYSEYFIVLPWKCKGMHGAKMYSGEAEYLHPL